MFLTIASKVFLKITLLRMKDPLEERLKDEQAGFRMKRSCCDHITTLKIIVEETLEWNTGLYMVSVDFEKAFSSINRDMLWKILCYDGVPSKTIKMIQVLYEGFQARVMHEGTMTEHFEMHMKTGVRQGCLLSPLLFLVVLDWVTRQAYGENKTEIQLSMLDKLEDLGFADDLVFLSQKITQCTAEVRGTPRAS